MEIPEEYIQVKDYLAGYMDMQKITAAFENEDDRIVKTTLMDNDFYWIAIMTDNPKNYSKRHLLKPGHKYSYSFYMNKEKSFIYLKASIKCPTDYDASKFFLENLFRKLNKEGIHDYEIMPNEDRPSPYEYGTKYIYLRVNFKDNFIENINLSLSLLEKYNKKMYSILGNKFMKNIK